MRRIRDPDLLALVHLEASECALTGSVDHLEAHHIYPRAQGGDDVRANLVMLSRDVHWRVTINDKQVLRLLGDYVYWKRPDFIVYLTQKLGQTAAEDWLRRRLLVDSVQSVR